MRFFLQAAVFAGASLLPCRVAWALPPEAPLRWGQEVLYFNNFDDPAEEGSAIKQENASSKLLNLESGIKRNSTNAYNDKSKLEVSFQQGVATLDKPLTVSFWWAPRAELGENQGIQLLDITSVPREGAGGDSYIGHILRGGGSDKWCGLNDTAAILQIQHFENFTDVNKIYDKGIRDRVNADGGKWHNITMVISGEVPVQLYWDGELVTEVQGGGSFTAREFIKKIIFGPVSLDNVIILNVAATGDEILSYYEKSSKAFQ
jgi:hypothetical protein